MATDDIYSYGQFSDDFGLELTMLMKTIDVNVAVDDIQTTFTVRQTFRNDRPFPIASQYQLPILDDAIFLGMEVQFGERKLKTLVQASDDAMPELKILEVGEGPILLKRNNRGRIDTYKADFGMVKSGETAVVEYRYAKQHTWYDQTLRVPIPAIISQHYLRKTEDKNSILPQWQFTLNAKGIAAKSSITCLTHPLSIKSANDGLQVTFATLPEQDLVLNFECENRPESIAICDRDKDGWIVAADFKPHVQGTENGSRLNLDIWLNCSDDIGQTAKHGVADGLMRILDSLGPNDFFNIILGQEGLFDTRRPADSDNVALAKDHVRQLLVNRWEFKHPRQAFESVFAMQGGKGSRSILLISNGFRGGERLRRAFSDSGYRIMTVLPGNDSKRFLHDVRWCIEETGGTCVSPSSEADVPGCIYAQCMRCRIPATEKEFVLADIEDNPKGLVATAEYDGDTIHAFARYTDKPSGDFRLKATLYGIPLSLTCAIPELDATAPDTPSPSNIARIAAASRLKNLNAETDKAIGSQLAIDYQLISPWTSILMANGHPSGESTDAQSTQALQCFEPIRFRNSWEGISHGSLVVVDMDGALKHCIADVDGGKCSWQRIDPNTSNIVLYDIEAPDDDCCLVQFQLDCTPENEPEAEESSSANDDTPDDDFDSLINCFADDYIFFEKENGPYPYKSVFEADFKEVLPKNMNDLRLWIRGFVSGHTAKENQIAQKNILRLLGGESSHVAVLVSSTFQDYANGDLKDVDRYYDAINSAFSYDKVREFRFRDAGDILLDSDMRIKVVAACDYDPENDVTSYTLFDLLTGEATCGERERKNKCIYLGNVRYNINDRIDEFDFYQKEMFAKIAKYIYCQLLLSDPVMKPTAQAIGARVAENLLKAVSKYPCKDDVPELTDLLTILTDAFIKMYESESVANT